MSRYHFLAAAVSTAVVATSLVPFNVYADAKDFTDVKKGNVYYEAVAYLAGQGTIKGYTDGTFKPNRVITRAEVASIVASSMNLKGKVSKDPGFSDVKKGVWYYEAVAALVEAGVFQGKTKNSFMPNEPITRSEFAKVLSLAYGLTENKEPATKFTDVHVNSWYSGYVGALIENQITEGVSPTVFGSNQALTRGQIALFMFRAETQSVKPFIIEKVTDQTITINGSSYKVDPSLASIFNASNANALKNAKIKFVEKAGVITSITYLELTNNGTFNAAVELNARGAAIAGDLKISADYVLLSNLVVKGNFEIGTQVQNRITADHVSVEGKTTIISDGAKIASHDKFYKTLTKTVSVDELQMAAANELSHVILESSKLNTVNVNKANVSIEATGSTVLNEVNISANASISATSGVTVNKVNLQIGANNVGISGSINQLNIFNTENVLLNGNAIINKLIVQPNGNNRVINLDFNGRIQYLEVTDPNAKIILKVGLMIGNIVIPEGTQISALIQNYDVVKKFIEKINGVLNPDLSPVPIEPGLQQAIENANLTKTTADSAKIAHIEAYGSSTDKTYVAVETSLIALEKTLTATFVFKSDIQAATANLVSAVTALQQETEVLIAEMKEAIGSANEAIADSDSAKTAYRAAYGLTTDKTYVAVEAAVSELKTTVNATFKVRADIDTATANLVSAVAVMEAETQVLISKMQQAIESANLAIADADAAKVAYRAAYGLTTDTSYVAVETAISDLKTAVNAEFKVRADIDTATANLSSAVAVLSGETAVLITEMQLVIESANLAIADADLAKAAYRAAYGLTTDETYVAVVTAISQLETEVNESFKVSADIDVATAKLVSAVAVLTDETAVLITEMQQAIESANLTVADANLAQIAYRAAYGLTTDASYVAVETAIAELETAVNAEFKVRTDIETATANLSSVVAVLNDRTAVLVTEMQQAIESANLSIANADVAKVAYSAAYGLKTDTSYVAVETAISELETAVKAEFKVRADIDTATAKLASATAVLNVETAVLITNMQQAIESANLTIANADVAKAAYSAAYGLTTDTSYVAVETAISELETTVKASFKVRADIDVASAKLAGATAVLNNETAVLITKMQQAIESANLTIANADVAKAAYSAAYGLTTDTSYVAVNTAISELKTAVNKSFKVRADIDTASAKLASATAVLNNETAVLITKMAQAMESANLTIANADVAKT
ncbi:S-layer homology domain-containing protein, partial [Paenisporosarcina indica]|uniref:S-layer homology domain-containing protein n=1 Tax=Paenisporosarcina indica TaxID=650093 RepID=UPI00094F83D1